MKQLKQSMYRWVLVSLIIGVFVLASAAYYTVGVVSKNDVIAQIDENIAAAESYLDSNEDAANLLFEEYEEDYIAKTRTIALFLTQTETLEADEQMLEELRVTVNADRISVSDTEGNIIASTDPSGEGDMIREEFQSHLSDTVYTDVLFFLESDEPSIVAASALDNGNGLVQITYPADTVVELLSDADLSNMASDVPLYSSGMTALLDAETLEYISCSDSALQGEVTAYDQTALTESKKGRFDAKDADGESVMIKFQSYGDYIILAAVPYQTIYHIRNVVVGWLVCGGVGLLLVAGLAVRYPLSAVKCTESEVRSGKGKTKEKIET